MLEKETKEFVISDELKRKVEIICRFANKKYTLINGSLIGYKGKNVAYVKPHILTIDNNDYKYKEVVRTFKENNIFSYKKSSSYKSTILV